MAKVILLGDAVSGYRHGMTRYIGPYALASQLNEAGYETLVIDYITSIPDLFSYLENFITPEVLAVGISSTFLSPPSPPWTRHRTRIDTFDNYGNGFLHFTNGEDLKNWILKLKNLLLKLSPHCKLVLGGAKALDIVYHPEAYEDFDYICVGAGDEPIVEMIRALDEGRNPTFFQRGRFKILGGLLKNQRKICPDARYSYKYGIQQKESLPIEVSRGCIFNCKFCYYEKKESIRKDLELLKQEMIRNYENFGTTVYHLTDDCFNDHREKVEAVCGMFMSLPFKVEWVSYARVDVGVKFPETLELMVKSGARGLFWGLESFHEQTARKAGKGTPIEKVKRMLIDFKKEFGGQCISLGSFITGLPGEPAESVRETCDWLCENDALDLVAVGPLTVGPYVPNFDKTVMDYSDYSRNPGKYGFKKITFNPRYWEHETMNSEEAETLARNFVDQFKGTRNIGFLSSIWTYPHLRSLGYSHDQLISALKKFDGSDALYEESMRRNQKFMEAIHGDILRGSGNTGDHISVQRD